MTYIQKLLDFKVKLLDLRQRHSHFVLFNFLCNYVRKCAAK